MMIKMKNANRPQVSFRVDLSLWNRISRVHVVLDFVANEDVQGFISHMLRAQFRNHISLGGLLATQST